MLETREAGRGVGDGAVEEQRGRARRTLAEERIEELLRRSAAGAPRTEDHAQGIVAFGRNRRAGILERHLGGGDRIDAGAIHPAHLHRRNPRGGVEAGDLRREGRTAARGVEPAQRHEVAAAFEQASRKPAFEVPSAERCRCLTR
jgi:hypothetical protein